MKKKYTAKLSIFSRTTLLIGAVSIALLSSAQAQECDIQDVTKTSNATRASKANFTCIVAKLGATLSRLERIEAETAPFRRAKGIVAAFDRSQNDACPKGWELFRPAGGRFIVGAGVNTNTDQAGNELTDHPSRLDDKTKAVGGAEKHTLTVAEMPSHSHRGNNVGTSAGRGNTNMLHPWGSSTKGQLAKEGVENSGGNQPHNNMPPYIALFYCTKT